jgi:phosphatidylserine/phosphatidylglycerophosphate/cardiolipin synthase-like enzyme
MKILEPSVQRGALTGKRQRRPAGNLTRLTGSLLALSLCFTSLAVEANPLKGATSGVTLHIEPDESYAPVLAFIQSAKKTLDFNIYQLNDTTIQTALADAAARGVRVRVMATWQTFPANSGIDDPTSSTFNKNVPVLASLKAQGVETALSPFMYTYSHEKTMIADGHTSKGRALIMDFNSQPSYFGPSGWPGEEGTRGFAIVNEIAENVKQIQQVFDADWKRVKPKSYNNPYLVWSPNGAGYKPLSSGQDRILELIDSAKNTLDLYALLIDYQTFQEHLEAACKRGVKVRVLTNASTQANATNPFTFAQLLEMSKAGIQFSFNPQINGGSLFVHSKTILRDAGNAAPMAFIGSENPGDYVSMNAERELGMLIANDSIVKRVSMTFERDWQSASSLQFKDGIPVNPFVPQ